MQIATSYTQFMCHSFYLLTRVDQPPTFIINMHPVCILHSIACHDSSISGSSKLSSGVV